MNNNNDSNSSKNIDSIVRKEQNEFIQYLKGLELRSNEIIEQEEKLNQERILSRCTLFFLSSSFLILILWFLFFYNS